MPSVFVCILLSSKLNIAKNIQLRQTEMERIFNPFLNSTVPFRLDKNTPCDVWLTQFDHLHVSCLIMHDFDYR